MGARRRPPRTTRSSIKLLPRITAEPNCPSGPLRPRRRHADRITADPAALGVQVRGAATVGSSGR